jgi:hypothetical protein
MSVHCIRSYAWPSTKIDQATSVLGFAQLQSQYIQLHEGQAKQSLFSPLHGHSDQALQRCAEPVPSKKGANSHVLGRRAFRLQLHCLSEAGDVIERRVVQCKVGPVYMLLNCTRGKSSNRPFLFLSSWNIVDEHVWMTGEATLYRFCVMIGIDCLTFPACVTKMIS